MWQLNKQGDISWAATRPVDCCPCLTESSVYREALAGLIHMYCLGGLNTLCSHVYILGTAPSVGTVGRMHIPRTGDEEPSTALVELKGQPQSHPLDDLLQ